MIFSNNSSKVYIPTFQAIEFNILDGIDSDDISAIQDDDDLQIYECHCGQKYFSQENYASHQRTKHSMIISDTMSQRKTEPDIKKEINPNLAQKVQIRFFQQRKRSNEYSTNVDLISVIEASFQFVYVKHKELCYTHPEQPKDDNLLRLLFEYKPIQESKGFRTIDQILYEYCLSVKYLTNTKYFKLILRNLLILREYWNQKNSDNTYTETHMIGELPLFCNDLIEKYLLNYGLKKADYKESMKIIHNLFNWLYYSEYSEYLITLNEKGNSILNSLLEN